MWPVFTKRWFCKLKSPSVFRVPMWVVNGRTFVQDGCFALEVLAWRKVDSKIPADLVQRHIKTTFITMVSSWHLFLCHTSPLLSQKSMLGFLRSCYLGVMPSLERRIPLPQFKFLCLTGFWISRTCFEGLEVAKGCCISIVISKGVWGEWSLPIWAIKCNYIDCIHPTKCLTFPRVFLSSVFNKKKICALHSPENYQTNGSTTCLTTMQVFKEASKTQDQKPLASCSFPTWTLVYLTRISR